MAKRGRTDTRTAHACGVAQTQRSDNLNHQQHVNSHVGAPGFSDDADHAGGATQPTARTTIRHGRNNPAVAVGHYIKTTLTSVDAGPPRLYHLKSVHKSVKIGTYRYKPSKKKSPPSSLGGDFP